MKIVLEMNHEEAISLLEELSISAYEDGKDDRTYTALTAIHKRLKESIKHPQADIEPDIEALGKLGD